MKIFFWKLCNHSLPTCVNMNKRMVLEYVLCPMCGNQPEIDYHLFFNMIMRGKLGIVLEWIYGFFVQVLHLG